ncbi:hypothetical protein TrCOL_g11238 [Triparma columacea]|uniref:AMP-dependent synthetase/ligase domain-containing protein n=1 Tax=Triparma columacea TaxID=722753 RepID=A0A9W7GNZ2_9STRA|nr:hypothetical protein TrCOL_g11238 [Triparma columacea]
MCALYLPLPYAVLTLVLLSILLLFFVWPLFGLPISLPLRMLDLLGLLINLKQKAKHVQKNEWSIVSDWEARVSSTPDSTFITHVNGNTFTFKEADILSHKVTNAALSLSILPGEVVAILVPSCPEYVCMWIGMARICVTSGLINTNLVGKPLVHAVSTAVKDNNGAKVLLASSEYKVAVEGARAELQAAGVKIVYYDHSASGSKDGSQSEFDKMLSSARPTSYPQGTRSWKKNLFYIYTSGTTGLPKASLVNHLRFYSGGSMLARLANVGSSDKIYCALPLYHSAGGMVGVSCCIITGCTMVLRSKFSVSNLSKDIVAHGCTVLQYIGEFARFALTGSKDAEMDAKCGKTLRVAFGNGMRPEVWVPFQKQFGIGRVVEFYGSTEGNANLCNNTGVPGAIGVVPSALKFIYPVCLAKCDSETGELTRDSNGMAIMAKPGEPGQLLGLIKDDDPARRFDGYTDKKATGKKIVCDVKKNGDKWFASGDLLRSDWFGFFFWVDRIGDTFRWKGENVSTAEVAAAFSGFDSSTSSKSPLKFVEDANVYGVELPNQDGRAGMARLTLRPGASWKDLDFDVLWGELAAQLPPYARPLFLRIPATAATGGDELMTGTFKHKKVGLREEGFDIDKVGREEVVLLRDDKKKSFVVIDRDVCSKLKKGEIRV